MPGTRLWNRSGAAPRLLAAAWLAAGAAVAAQAQDIAQDIAQNGYKIGPGDSLAVSIFGQPELSGTYVVRSNGAVVLHLLGAIPVAGLDLQESEAQIVEKAAVVFQNSPSVVVDIAAYRDIYVLGAVDTPGVYPYRPGMTAMMAIAKAGGAQRAEISSDGQAVRLLNEQRQILLSRGRIEILETQIAELDQEIAGFQSGEATAPGRSPLIQVGRQILEAELLANDQTRTLAQEEADTLARSQALLESRLAAADAALADGRARAEAGYFPPERLEQLQLAADTIREDLLDVSAASARARRFVSEAANEGAVARIRYLGDLLAERTSAEAEMTEEQVTLQTSVEFVMQYGGLDAASAGEVQPVERLILTRVEDGTARDIPATRATMIEPEDVLTVEMVLPAAPVAAAD